MSRLHKKYSRRLLKQDTCNQNIFSWTVEFRSLKRRKNIARNCNNLPPRFACLVTSPERGNYPTIFTEKTILYPLNPINTIVLWCTGGFRGALNWSPLMPRDISLSDRCKSVCDGFPVWQSLYTEKTMLMMHGQTTAIICIAVRETGICGP